MHLLTTLEELEYQTWPEDHIPERLRCRGAGSSNFRLPRWTRKAVKAATKSLRSNFPSSIGSSTPEPANVNVLLKASVRKTSRPQSIKQPNGGKQLRDSANAKGHSQLQSQLPQSKKRPQTQQSSSTEQQPQTQQTSSKKKQPQTQQSSSKKKQPQKQQPQNNSLRARSLNRRTVNSLSHRAAISGLSCETASASCATRKRDERLSDD